MTEEKPTEQDPKDGEAKDKQPKLARREDVIESSRRMYGTPRAEVEIMIAKQMGWPTPDEQRDQMTDRLSHQLQGFGVTERQAKYLITTYSLERIQQQLDWLPYRGARNPSAFILAAIRHNYEPPEGLYVKGNDEPDSDSTDTGQRSTENQPKGNE
jgi:hypothetical protein